MDLERPGYFSRFINFIFTQFVASCSIGTQPLNEHGDVCHSMLTHQKTNRIDHFGVAERPTYYPRRPCTNNGNTIPQLAFSFEVVALFSVKSAVPFVAVKADRTSSCAWPSVAAAGRRGRSLLPLRRPLPALPPARPIRALLRKGHSSP